MRYPYTCPTCGPFEVLKRMADATRPETCPVCGTTVSEQDYGAKNVNNQIPAESKWVEGRPIVQLPVNHPDYMVTSKTQMERVYKKHGISMDTGHFVSNEAQQKATLPRSKRKGFKGAVTGGVIDQD